MVTWRGPRTLAGAQHRCFSGIALAAAAAGRGPAGGPDVCGSRCGVRVRVRSGRFGRTVGGAVLPQVQQHSRRVALRRRFGAITPEPHVPQVRASGRHRPKLLIDHGPIPHTRRHPHQERPHTPPLRQARPSERRQPPGRHGRRTRCPPKDDLPTATVSHSSKNPRGSPSNAAAPCATGRSAREPRGQERRCRPTATLPNSCFHPQDASTL
jgi:hypothetical protein